jgi:hypothetical protein
MKRSWILLVFLPLILVVLGSVGCDRRLQSVLGDSDTTSIEPVESAPQNRSTEASRVGTQQLTTDDELVNQTAGVRMTLPSSWSLDDRLHDSAELQASDRQQQLYVIVLAEDGAALRQLGLSDIAANYRDLLAQRLSVYESASPTDVAFVGSNYANQYEVRGRLANDTPVVYLHTTVAGEDGYYQIVAWTTPEQYEIYRPELQIITESFREIGS